MKTIDLFLYLLYQTYKKIDWRIISFLDRRLYPTILSNYTNFTFGKELRLHGLPRLEVTDGSSVVLGDNVVLRSRNLYNHLAFYSPVTLISNKPGSKITIGDRSVISASCIHAEREVFLGKDCLLAANVQIFDCPGHAPCWDSLQDRKSTRAEPRPVMIEDHVWLGSNSIILPGAQIGYGSIVASGSVVSGRFQSHSFIMGNPAKLVIRQKKNCEMNISSPETGS